MTERHAELDAAIDRVIAAARRHLEAVKAADGRADDAEVWRAYVELNNRSCDYDELLLDMYGEVTPWDVDPIDPEQNQEEAGVGSGSEEALPDDPYPRIISIRQRRDYRIPSVSALLELAEAARLSTRGDDDDQAPVIETVGEAVLELMQIGDGSLGSLDELPELDPLDGMVIVAEVENALDPSAFPDSDAVGPFSLGEGDRVMDRMDEHAYFDLEAASAVDQASADDAEPRR